MFALVDCNNFYASCERLFRPDLHGKPIVVLSSGDGCVIARSNEAKALGIQTGDPFFKIKSFCMQHRVHVFSSNFTLYRDMSQRVMSVIEDAWEEVEIYSVDEAFLDISSLHPERQASFCIELQKRILKWTGIPVSIGLGTTKTLAKISNHVAKKVLKVPVFNVMDDLNWLKKIDIGDVWGIGRQWRKKLVLQGIATAYDLTQIDAHQLKRQYNIVLMKTAMELQGVSCMQLEDDAQPKKSILSSRSFHHMETTLDVLAQAMSMHCASVYDKLREQHSLARCISVFMKTNRFREDLPQYNPSASVKLVVPTDDIRVITRHAKQCLQEIYQSGFQYKKVGVWLDDLSSNETIQCDLFEAQDEALDEKSNAFLNVFDSINRRFGKNTVRLASTGYDRVWDTRFECKSPAYTTRWSELPVIPT